MLMRTLDVTGRIEGRRRLLSLGLTWKEIWNLPILMYIPFNGILHLPPNLAKLGSAMITACFGLVLLLLIVRNRFHVRWELWTCRIAALLTLDIVLSAAWDSQPLITAIYPSLVAILLFFYANYLLDHFSANSFTRMMLWSFGILLVLSLIVSLALPSMGIDNGADDPNNIGAWQGVFAQKNQLGMATVVAVSMALGIRPKTQIDLFWRAVVVFVALACAVGSRSREAWAAITLQIVAMAFLWVLRRFRSRAQLFMLLGGMLLAVLFAIVIYSNLDSLLALVDRSRTASGRTYIWEASFLLIRRRPWLGYGVYGVWHTPIAWEVVARTGWNVPSAHNNYIEILLYYGIIGLTIYLSLLFASFFYGLRAFRTNRVAEIVPAVYIVIGVLLLSMTSPITVYFPSVALLLMIFYISRLEQLGGNGFSLSPPS